mmetsp:Transcript_29006/g.78111  ORF Transcript_29006/g.78111 Transcript_29006/m.78111 type:complete len:619 (+) Transcript_29006:95-1951(+)|eukprot:CAMPEP_0202358308 /NCGR_PEP_ID=MMETSP1126-20121109/12021_1 /ASSEMBLY_ACC=CAM_ASM_000457 /TAXON_ID=3047 /ORGANISM="Dunaliella tertiolecta, Strain CCMP1320" /LENGTH=618 /DNA_ID=CAMNT_0048951431 /DNA_START=40 /DNA_END=1896 /DNA_ORIENTATION=-
MGFTRTLPCVAAFLVVAAAQIASAEVKLQSVTRKINLNSQFAKVSETIKVKNTGSDAVSSLILCQTRRDAVLAFQQVSQQLQEQKVTLKAVAANPAGAPGEAECWEVGLVEALPGGGACTLESLVVYAEAQKPYPAEVEQGEPQLMLFVDNALVLSPYQVSQQSTEVIMPSPKVKSFSESPSPVTKMDGNKYKYGKYDLVKPWSVAEMRLHYENNKPFKKAMSLVREIEISHWGNIYVEETYEVKNAGAQHKGSFSRLKHTYASMAGGSKGNSFRELKARLPSSAHSIYYVDQIGNVSTSDVRKASGDTMLTLNTRYPLQGGWKVDFKIGYGVPLEGFLSKKSSDGKRRLTMDFNSPVDGLYVEDMTVKVVLPEGASSITSHVPKGTLMPLEESRDVKFSYLDTIGRPVVVLHTRHLVPDHATKFHVEYTFATVGLLREPLLLIAAFAALFVAAIAYNRLELTISRDEKWQAAKDIEMIATLMHKAESILLEQGKVIDAEMRLSASIRSGDDVDHAQKERPKLDATFNDLEKKGKAVLANVAQTQPRAADKAMEVLEKARGLHARCLKHVSERSDQARKSTSPAEMQKKLPGLQSTANALEESRTELNQLIESVFAPY